MKLKDISSFLSEDIWRVTKEDVNPLTYRLCNILKVLILTIQRFLRDRIVQRASALTYSTLLSIVPILAILFAIARGFGFANLMEMQIRQGFEGHSLVVETLLGWIDSYLEHAQSGVFIGVGLVMLLWTVLTLTDNIERNFNQIWQVKKPRSVFRKFTDYFSIFLLLPILIVVSGGLSVFMTTTLTKLEQYALMAPLVKIFFRLVPFIFTSLMLIALYIFMPNTKVKLRNALLPGIVAGIAFQFLQYFYINSQIWVANYNAIYGSFAAIPLFLLWTQISWCICLFGAQLTYASQNVETYNFEKDARNISRRYHDFLCILLMSAVCKRFARGEHPYTADELSRMHRIPIRIVNEIIYELQDLELLYPVTEDEKSDTTIYLPAEDTTRLTVREVLKRIDVEGSENFKIDHTGEYSHEWQALARAKEAYYQQSDVLLKEL
ncbi:MAG: YihY/virulence factor BrkB family protein [Bacteroidaceae bacterium]|nr:YihY/virulence factor BrkB family protein [Bacteroidaceae bacterium]